MSSKSELTITFPTEIKVHRVEDQMPLVGWHNPWAEITYQGQKWDLRIGGGCQTICLSRVDREKDDPSMSYYYVSIEELLPAIFEAIRKGKRK